MKGYEVQVGSSKVLYKSQTIFTKEQAEHLVLRFRAGEDLTLVHMETRTIKDVKFQARWTEDDDGQEDHPEDFGLYVREASSGGGWGIYCPPSTNELIRSLKDSDMADRIMNSLFETKQQAVIKAGQLATILKGQPDDGQAFYTPFELEDYDRLSDAEKQEWESYDDGAEHHPFGPVNVKPEHKRHRHQC